MVLLSVKVAEASARQTSGIVNAATGKGLTVIFFVVMAVHPPEFVMVSFIL